MQVQHPQRPFPAVKPEVGQVCNVYFKGERNSKIQLPVQATWTEDGWQVKIYMSPEVLKTIYAWEPVEG